MKKLYITTMMVMITLMMVMSVNAESTSKQNEQISLIQTCNNCTYCNISKIVNPSSSVILSNLIMTKDGSSYNFTLNNTYTNQVGTYYWYYDCGNVAEKATGRIQFEITPTGYSRNLILFYIIIIIIPWALFLIGLWKKDMTFAVLGTLGFYIVSLYLLIMGIDGIKDFMSNAIGVIHLGVAFYTSIRYTLESIDINW